MPAVPKTENQLVTRDLPREFEIQNRLRKYSWQAVTKLKGSFDKRGRKLSFGPDAK